MHATFAALLAIGWQPELRGIIVVVIAVGVLMGSVYLVLATNLGARLGFLVTLAALFGWLAMMGFVWMIYGIGLQGPLGSWKEVPGRTVLQDTNALVESEVLNDQVEVPDGVSFSEESAAVAQAFEDEGWERLDSSSQEFGQAGAAGGHVRRGGRRLRRRRLRGQRRVRHRRRALPVVVRLGLPRLPRLLPRAPTRRRRAGPDHPHLHRGRTGSGLRPDRRDGPADSTCTWCATSAPADSRRRCSPSVGRSSSSRCAGCCTAATASSPPTDPRCR